MEALTDSTGFLGYMILKQIGVCALGSFMLDPVSMGESLQTLGANPPKNPKALFKTLDAVPSPPEYLIHSEWDATEMAQLGFAKVLVNHQDKENSCLNLFGLKKGKAIVTYRYDRNIQN